MLISSAAFSICRRCGGGSVRCFSFATKFVPWPAFQKMESPQPKISRVPHLMLCSAANPQIRYLYDLGDDSRVIKLNRKFYLPEIAGQHCIGSSYGFVFAMVGDIVVGVNPLSGDRLRLPSVPRVPAADTRYGCSDPFLDIHSKVTLSPSLDIAILLRRTKRSHGYAYFARLAPMDDAWTPIPWPILPLDDCAFHKGHFITADCNGHLTTCKDTGDPSRPRSLLITSDLDVRANGNRSYLVESPDGDDLFLVHRDEDQSHFSVWKLADNDWFMWEPVISLGGLAFFVGPVRCFSLLAADFQCLKADSIYFTTDLRLYCDLQDYKCGGLGDSGVFNLQDGSMHFFQLPDERDETDWPPPTWVAP